MIVIETTDVKRSYVIFNIVNNKKTEITKLNLVFSPVTNKFDRLSSFIEDCSLKIGKSFDNWFSKFIKDYIKSNRDYSVIKNNIPKLMKYADQYLEKCDIDFSAYINRSKISKNTIFFDEDDIKQIIQVSNYLKLYFILSQDQYLRLPQKFHKEVYNILVKKITESDIVYKLFKIVSSKTYEYNHSDKYMWDYIKTIYCKTTDMHIMSIFNFIMNNILVTCETSSNPVPYMISVIDESIKWILKNIYKDAIVYSESINTQDVYTVKGKDNLSSYAYNDTIGKLLVAAHGQLEVLKLDLDTFKDIVKGLKKNSIIASYITFPILSKVLDMPYKHLTTIPAEHGYLLNILVYNYLPDEFINKYPIIKKMLLYYNTENPILKTTYKIKNITEFVNTFDTFLSMKNMMKPYDIYSSIVGKISRNSYSDFYTNQKITNFPLSKLETDIIHFFNDYFSGKLDNMCKEIEEKINTII